MTTRSPIKHNLPRRQFLALAALLLALCELQAIGRAQEDEGPVVLREFLILPRVGEYGRSPIHIDPVQAAIATGEWRPPQAGDMVTGAAGYEVEWLTASAQPDAWLRHTALRGGYAFAEVDWPRDEVLLLEAQGHAMVYANGEPRAGDPYETGLTVLPVQMHKGPNTFLFHVARGELQATLVKPVQDVSIDLRDATLPDLVDGESGTRWVGVLVINARPEPLAGFRCTAIRAGSQPMTTAYPSIPPCSVRKIAVPVNGDMTRADANTHAVRVQLDLTEAELADDVVLATAAFDLAVVAPDAPQTRTFLSAIDGSVQPYALLPAIKSETSGELTTGLMVTLHDAGVSADEHLEDCAAQEWAHVLAPMGRRPHGFDWEDWSARDVGEAVNDASQHVHFDESKQWLAGMATGGHGVLHLGTREPGRWAALAPRNAWLSYRTFGGGLPNFSAPTPIELMLLRAANMGDTMALVRNLAPAGVHVEHNPRDAVVPVEQSRMMREQLAQFHTDFAYREPRAAEVAAQANGFISAGIARFLEDRQTRPHESVELATFDPGATSPNGWLTIAQQAKQLELSTASVEYHADQRSFVGTTANVATLAIDVSWLESGAVDVVLDGESLGPVSWPESVPLQLWFVRTPAGWRRSLVMTSQVKTPLRYGNFKSVFDRRVVFVYGTRGDEAENAWALAKARYDAEQFLARANGSIEVIADAKFHPGRYPFHNVVLYGNADTNATWPSLLSTSPVQVRRGRVRVGLRPESGDDLACVFVRPRSDSDRNLVAAVSGTGISGFRAADRLPYFVSGVVLPDFLLFGAKSLVVGVDDVRALGSFGLDWSVESAEIVWRDAAL